MENATGESKLSMSFIGNNNIEAEIDTMPVGYISSVVFTFTATEDKAIAEINLYCSADTLAHAKMFVYSDTNTVPGSKLATSNEVTINDASWIWRKFTLSSQLLLKKGSTYRFAWMSDAPINVRYGVGTTNQWVYAGSNLVYPNAPDVFPVMGYSDSTASVYANYIDVPQPIVVPTPTDSLFGPATYANARDEPYATGYKTSCRFIAKKNGMLSGLGVYGKTVVPAYAKLALYADDETLIGVVNETSTQTVDSWIKGSFPTQIQVTQGVAYKISVMFSADGTIGIMDGNQPENWCDWNQNAYAAGFSNPFGETNRYQGNVWCLYAIGTEVIPPVTLTVTSTPITGVPITITELTGYPLTINVVGSGSVAKTPNQTIYTQGTTVQLLAAAAAGWTFNGWSGDLSGSTNPATITMNSSKNITATFTQNSDPVYGPNLAPMFQGNNITQNEWGDAYKHNGNFYYGSEQAGEIDRTNLSPNGNPSMKVYSRAPEVDHKWFNVAPGDRIIFKVWIKTEGTPATQKGANGGFDFYGICPEVNKSYSLGDGLPSSGSEYCTYSLTNWNPNSPAGNWSDDPPGIAKASATNVMFVRWGTTNWVQQTYDVIVPDRVYTKTPWDEHGNPVDTTIPATLVDGIIPWIGANIPGGTLNAWFADAELYIIKKT